ncbi:unnamed protein product [Pedinophyceae sp. YPF-701]|nr:unnamed protein product [Pedinophyceae sp. YPF-701]
MSDRFHVLVTGGTGFIGSHTVVSLLQQIPNSTVHIMDNYWNSSKTVLERIHVILGDAAKGRITLQRCDLRDRHVLEEMFQKHKFDAVIHFAGFKAVGESVKQPLWYYSNNIAGSVVLFEMMKKYDVKTLVFSSSATVYGEPEYTPIDENHPIRALNPYGRTKLFIEEICRDLANSEEGWNIVLLRYFNPVGAHPSGLIGEDPVGIPNNLMPFVQKVALGKLPKVNVFGNDYPTKDGTGVRDYIHVVDLADAHVAALNKTRAAKSLGCVVYNVGTGQGTSVLEMIAAMKKACGKDIPYEIAPRRPGDSAVVYAKTDFAKQELGWEAKYNIEDMVRDQWNWASNNPEGYPAGDGGAVKVEPMEFELNKD